MQSPASLRVYWRLISQNSNFRRIWIAQVVSEIGDWFYALAIYNLLLELTGSAAAVGIAVVLQVLPSTFAGPTAGVVNDRVSRRKIMIGADLARVAIVACMLLVRSRSMVWLVWPLLLMETLMMAFFEPAHNAVLPNIVGEEDILAANTVSSVTWSFCLAVGAALGGVAGVLLGRDAVFVLNALSFLASAALIARTSFAEPHVAGAPPLRARDLTDFSPILEGIRYIRSQPRLFATVFVKGGLGLMGANNVILPILGERVFPVQIGAIPHQRAALMGMSALMAARGAGALLGPFVSAQWAGQKQHRLRLGILGGFLVASVGYVAVGFSPSVWLAIAAVILAHSGGSTIWVFSTTLLQIYTDDRFRGRVFAADFGLCMLTISISSYVGGLAIDWGVPVRTFAIYMGLALLLPAALWAAVLRTKDL